MNYLQNRINLAQRELGRSVVSINNIYTKKEMQQNNNVKLFGIKDTKQIPSELISRLQRDPKMMWLTIDKASDKGRAIDTDLNNPITYRLMTGSTSGGPINLLKGINDVAIGTDGGGSVLAPAMSCQLPSVIGSGLGLHVNKSKRSTDGSEFWGSVGAVAKSINALKDVMECLTGTILNNEARETMKIAIPKRGSIKRPDQKDMGAEVMNYLNQINTNAFELAELDMSGTDDRKNGMESIQAAFEQHQADLIVTYEGPIDLYGYGESIPQMFGEIGKDITSYHGKYLVRSANMSQTTAITVPTENLASGLVVIAKKGFENAGLAFYLARELEKIIRLPNIWKRYFLEEQQYDGRELD